MDNFKDIWAKRRQEKAAIAASGQVVITQGPLQARIHVVCPFHVKFAVAAREFSGKWKPRSAMWVFPAVSKRLVIELCVKVYGKSAVTLVGFPPE